jgi:hypothetical protein
LNVSYDLGFAKPVVQYYKGTKNITSITGFSQATMAGAANSNGIMTVAMGESTYKALTYGVTVLTLQQPSSQLVVKARSTVL